MKKSSELLFGMQNIVSPVSLFIMARKKNIAQRKKQGKNHEAMRQEIIATASKIFSKHGFRKTNLTDIAKACRRGHSSLYYYFASKEELFRSVIEHEFHLLITELKEILQHTIEPQQKLKMYLTSRMNKINMVSNFYDTLKNDFFDTVPYVEAIRRKFDQQEFALISAILNEGKQKNIFSVENTETVTQAIISAMRGLEVPFFFRQVMVDIENRIDELLNILFYGIMKRN